MPAKKRAIKTRHEKEREKEAAKVMICQGQASADVARALGINHGTLRNWISNEGWSAEIKQAQELMKSRVQNPTIAQRVAFDFAETKKETRSAWARSSLKVAKWAEETAQNTPEVLFEMGSQYKAHVEASAKVAGDWEDASANKYAVALNLNQYVSSGAIREAGEDVRIVEE
jgi:hypothetical protein